MYNIYIYIIRTPQTPHGDQPQQNHKTRHRSPPWIHAQARRSGTGPKAPWVSPSSGRLGVEGIEGVEGVGCGHSRQMAIQQDDGENLADFFAMNFMFHCLVVTFWNILEHVLFVHMLGSIIPTGVDTTSQFTFINCFFWGYGMVWMGMAFCCTAWRKVQPGRSQG